MFSRGTTLRDALSARGRAREEARMARETDIAAAVGRRYWREAEARVVVEAGGPLASRSGWVRAVPRAGRPADRLVDEAGRGGPAGASALPSRAPGELGRRERGRDRNPPRRGPSGAGLPGVPGRGSAAGPGGARRRIRSPMLTLPASVRIHVGRRGGRSAAGFRWV